MNQDADQLREAFVAHEYLAPDAAEVLAVAHVRAAGIAVAAVRLREPAAQYSGPGWLPAASPQPAGCPNNNGRHGGSTISMSAPSPQPSPSPTRPSHLGVQAHRRLRVQRQ